MEIAVGTAILAGIIIVALLLRERSRAQTLLLDQFKVLSASALQENSSTFFQVAEQTLKQYQELAKRELDAKGESIKDVLTPLKETMHLYNDKLLRLENEQHLREGRLSEQLAQLVSLNQTLQKETANLVGALRRPEVRGAWGEIQLRRVVELAGMVEYCDFVTQETVATEEGRFRPDMIIKLPSERTIVIDAKTVLSAYIDAVEATSDAVRRACIERHARQLRDQIHLLSSKGYAQRYETSPEFVVCFLPGEAFLYAACDADRDLVEYGMKRGVVLATPTTLMALLKAVSVGWRQEDIAKNAKVIGEAATELIERLTVAIEHLQAHGQHLAKSVDSYNHFVGSLDRRVMPQAERILSLGVGAKKTIPDLVPLDTFPRDCVTEKVIMLKK